MKKHVRPYLLATGLASVSVFSGCEKESETWKNSPGTNGFINMKAVNEAFIKHPKVEDFEKRVNEIFEGDKIIIFSSESLRDGFRYTAKEDLDNNKEISSADDTLFTITIIKKKATLKGFGVNGYYSETWTYQPPEEEKEKRYSRNHYRSPYFHYWYWGRGWGGYYTRSSRYDDTSRHRSSYRTTDNFKSQVKNNIAYEDGASKRYGKGFRKSASRLSSNRSKYINNTMRSSSFNSQLSQSKSTSGWGNRSKSGKFASTRSSFSKGSGFGGFRGSSGFGV